MKQFRIVPAFLVALSLGLAACSADSTGPAPAAPRAPALSAAPGAGQYMVVFNGNKVPATFAAQVQALGGTMVFEHGNSGFAVVGGLDDAAAAKIKGMNGVSDVQADVAITLDDPQPAAEMDVSELAAFANDQAQSQTNPTTAARYAWQWNMRLIHAPTAWAAGKLGSSSITVAILDSGLDYNIADLNGLVDLARSRSFIPTDDSIAVHYFPTRNLITDFNGHGTNVATQVSSKAFALAGVTSRTTLIGVKVLNRSGSGSLSAVLSGVLYAADQGANVANMSLGSSFSKVARGPVISIINRTFNYAHRKGMMIVVSAGNDAADLDHNGNTFVSYCDAPHVVCVSSVGPEVVTANPDNSSYFTNFGRSAVTVAGPGGNADAAHGFTVSAWPWGNDIASWVWSYCPKDRIASVSATGVPTITACAAGNRLSGVIGTSQASPHVAGLAALLMAEYGASDLGAIKDRITSTAIDLGPAGPDPFYGRGRIDVARALGL
ncbi:S8 family serine peptidase [Longimicrobium sp.]|uniref:S8 family serine peptidase n=1 Tax=Longimicrobium sp. TaxID=2029185 RepID=UPI002CFC1F38|nr:S8 family serine peptidase [Longimicrobium sp.]HSU12959.1 S8 family serine peptidase [Longimicrobium sp.]